MSRAFVSNMSYFIKEGAISESLSKPAKKLAHHLEIIVSSVTAPRQQTPQVKLMCWATSRRKLCGGMIDASIDIGNLNIIWHCLKCGDHGSIYNWQHTFLDGGSR